MVMKASSSSLLIDVDVSLRVKTLLFPSPGSFSPCLDDLDSRLLAATIHKQVKNALAVMIQHNLVKFEANDRNSNIAEYSAISHHIYCLLRYPKYLYMMKRMFGDLEEMLLEILLNHGQASASNVIFMAAKRLNEARGVTGELMDPISLHEKLVNLAANQYIVRCPCISADAQKIPTFVVDAETDPFVVPPLNLGIIAQKLKENAPEIGEHTDSTIIWRVNFQRFDVEMRNVILVNAAARRVDPIAGELYHLLLQLWSRCSSFDAPITNFIDFHQIKDAVRKNANCSALLRDHFDQYLRVLCEDSSNLIIKAGDAGGGQYLLNYKSVFENLACATLDSIVLEKFGSKALRLFRLTRTEKYIEHDGMHNASMILPKEVKMFSYKLVEHNFLQFQELKKGTSSSAPVKSFVLFYVDLPQVARTALDLTFKGIFNALILKEHVEVENKRLIEKFDRMEILLRTLRAEDASEDDLAYVEESMTQTEKTLVKKVQAMTDQLALGESQVDESILILESYIHFLDSK
nr:EOG090X04YD [Eurycercus lamellatus]